MDFINKPAPLPPDGTGIGPTPVDPPSTPIQQQINLARVQVGKLNGIIQGLIVDRDTAQAELDRLIESQDNIE